MQRRIQVLQLRNCRVGDAVHGGVDGTTVCADVDGYRDRRVLGMQNRDCRGNGGNDSNRRGD
jgi:hypothetical protein